MYLIIVRKGCEERDSAHSTQPFLTISEPYWGNLPLDSSIYIFNLSQRQLICLYTYTQHSKRHSSQRMQIPTKSTQPALSDRLASLMTGRIGAEGHKISGIDKHMCSVSLTFCTTTDRQRLRPLVPSLVLRGGQRREERDGQNEVERHLR